MGLPLISLLRIDDFTHDAMRLHRRARCSSLLSFDCDCRIASCDPRSPGAAMTAMRTPSTIAVPQSVLAYWACDVQSRFHESRLFHISVLDFLLKLITWEVWPNFQAVKKTEEFGESWTSRSSVSPRQCRQVNVCQHRRIPSKVCSEEPAPRLRRRITP
jgi:hypothetical protein